MIEVPRIAAPLVAAIALQVDANGNVNIEMIDPRTGKPAPLNHLFVASLLTKAGAGLIDQYQKGLNSAKAEKANIIAPATGG